MYFEIYQNNSGQWQWRAIADNDSIVTDSTEAYRHKADCLAIVIYMKAYASSAEVVDLNPS